MSGEKAYRPVSCDFHDRLEDFAVRRRRVRIKVESEDADLPASPDQDRISGPEHEGLIRDIRTTDRKEEFLTLDDGTDIRLDRILDIEAVG